MTTIIVTSSRSPHGNTRRIADTLSAGLDARVVSPAQATADLLADADLIGFGSGIYSLGFDERLVDCIATLPDMAGRAAFIFASSGLPEPPFARYTKRLARQLERRGFRVVGTFVCRGVDTWGPFKLVGGVSREHPSAADFERARSFAAGL
ncbi:flavodoxin family protein [Gordonia sp. ABSL49_1]|uniref:flavodoxin family protein n=1 Tax=Gordonia sp. ABSL49_1 TaxID=2920941 RepID=UPI001F0DE1A7|nr:flavodoxin family protein [Gordonia sp. ABSL49_1]MCH5643125.1 flavodoxin family protein [Gordonia sp. ABSL49_1]